MNLRMAHRAVFVAGALLLPAASSHAQTATPQTRARAILRGSAYPFCHDAERRPGPDELAYCAYLGPQSACPEFRRACDAMLTQFRDHPRAPPMNCGGPSLVGLAGAARTAFIGVIAILALAALWFIVRGIVRARRKTESSDVKPDTDDERPSSAPIPSAPSGDLYDRALAAHASGQWAEALYLLFASLLRRLDERGVIHIETSRTNGEYVRECVPDDLRSTLRDAVRVVETVKYGGRAATSEAFERLRPHVEPIVRAATVWALVVLLGGGVQSCSGGGGLFGRRENSARGHRAVRELLVQEGLSARLLSDPLGDLASGTSVVFLDAEMHRVDSQTRATVLQWVDRGGALILGGGATEWGTDIGAPLDGTASAGTDVQLSETYGSLHAQVPEGSPVFGASLQAQGVAASVAAGRPYVVWLPRGNGRVLAFASPELLTNGALAVGDNPAAVVAMIRGFAGGRPIDFVETVEGESRNPLRSLSEAGLLPLVLQVLLIVALFYLLVGRHFGTPRDRDVVRRRAFAEHVRALGTLYGRARTSRAALMTYAGFVTERFRERSIASQAGLAEVIAARVGTTSDDVSATLEAIQGATIDPAAKRDEGVDLVLIQKLNEWVRRL